MELSTFDKKIDFIKYSKYFFVLSVILVALSLGLIFTKGFSKGIDFGGGIVAQLKYDGNAPISDIRKTLSSDERFKGVSVTEFDSSHEVLVKVPYSIEMQNIGSILPELLSGTGSFEIRRVDAVGPKAGKELKMNGIISLSLAFLSILLYVSFRYEWRFALAAVLALVHDVIISSASIIIFDIDLNLEVIAALLTIIGYSINDTIIVFDRIREQIIKGSFSRDIGVVMNDALCATLSRTLLTSLTVFFVVFTLYAFGGEIIRGFSLPMLVGVIVGTYSSIFLATRFVILFGFSCEKYRQKEIEKIKKAQERKKNREMYQNGRV